MRKIKGVLRLRAQGFSTWRLSRATRVGKTIVIEYLRRAGRAGVSWPLPVVLDEAALERLLFPPPASAKGRRIPEPDWAAVYRELKRPEVTLALLWDEYRGGRPDGDGYSAFCERYRRSTRSWPHKWYSPWWQALIQFSERGGFDETTLACHH